MASLLALFGPKRGVRLEIGPALSVGRSSATDVQLIDEKVSREHCKFTVEGATVTVADLGSHNGTYVNGAKISGPVPLAAGDEIAIGDSLFVLDGDLDVAPARFGDATLIVAPPASAGTQAASEPAPAASRPSGDPAALSAIVSLTAKLAAASDPESGARAILGAIDEALKPDRAFVLLWDASRKLATPLVGKSDGSAVSISRTVLDAAAASGRAVVVDDAVEDRALKDAKSVVRHRLRSVLVAPILSGTAVKGFLHADRKAKGAYGAADGALLEALAGIAAVSGIAPLQVPGIAPLHAPPRSVPDAPVAESASFKEALRIAASAAPVSSTVLITGESGTGKEEVARFLHAGSPRAARAFVAVNCGAIAETLAESELFGHEKGAFTGATGAREGKVEAADGGTLFLDEVGELSPAVQVKLLRVLQERAFYRVGSTVPRRVDIRVVAATHRNLEEDVKSGRFREDLYYRLNVLRIHLAPLRERAEDLAPLSRALLARLSASLGRRDPGLSDDALKALRGHAWPGNARELANVLERMVVLRRPGVEGPLSREEASAALGGLGSAGERATISGSTLGEKVAALEKTEVEQALRKARGVKTRAAEMLGISRPTLDKKIEDLKIDLWKEEA